MQKNDYNNNTSITDNNDDNTYKLIMQKFGNHIAKTYLKTKLVKHQEYSLLWMLLRERFPYFGIRGGINAKSMGLGKTLEMLMLILFDKISSIGFMKNIPSNAIPKIQSYLDIGIPNHIKNNNNNKTTLVVIDNASLSHWQTDIKTHFNEEAFKYIILRDKNEVQKEYLNIYKNGYYDIVFVTYALLGQLYSKKYNNSDVEIDKDIAYIDNDDDIISPISKSNSNKSKVKYDFDNNDDEMDMDVDDKQNDNYNEDPRFGVFECIWKRIICDEAHIIRNPKVASAYALRHIKSIIRWAVTGTPIHNSLTDCVSLYAFLDMQHSVIRAFKNRNFDCSEKSQQLSGITIDFCSTINAVIAFWRIKTPDLENAITAHEKDPALFTKYVTGIPLNISGFTDKLKSPHQPWETDLYQKYLKYGHNYVADCIQETLYYNTNNKDINNDTFGIDNNNNNTHSTTLATRDFYNKLGIDLSYNQLSNCTVPICSVDRLWCRILLFTAPALSITIGNRNIPENRLYELDIHSDIFSVCEDYIINNNLNKQLDDKTHANIFKWIYQTRDSYNILTGIFNDYYKKIDVLDSTLKSAISQINIHFTEADIKPTITKNIDNELNITSVSHTKTKKRNANKAKLTELDKLRKKMISNRTKYRKIINDNEYNSNISKTKSNDKILSSDDTSKPSSIQEQTLLPNIQLKEDATVVFSRPLTDKYELAIYKVLEGYLLNKRDELEKLRNEEFDENFEYEKEYMTEYGISKKRKISSDIISCAVFAQESTLHPDMLRLNKNAMSILEMSGDKTVLEYFKKYPTPPQFDIDNNNNNNNDDNTASVIKKTKKKDLQNKKNKIDEFISNAYTRLVSTKMRMIKQYFDNNVKNDEKVVIFSRFTMSLKIVGTYIQDVIKHKVRYMTGQDNTEKKEELINAFWKTDTSEFKVFLLTTKSNSQSINLARANHVILLDPWYNPRPEDQALERIVRKGQTRIPYKVAFLIKDSFEQVIYHIACEKSQLAYATTGVDSHRRKHILDDNIDEPVDILKLMSTKPQPIVVTSELLTTASRINDFNMANKLNSIRQGRLKLSTQFDDDNNDDDLNNDNSLISNIITSPNTNAVNIVKWHIYSPEQPKNILSLSKAKNEYIIDDNNNNASKKLKTTTITEALLKLSEIRIFIKNTTKSTII